MILCCYSSSYTDMIRNETKGGTMKGCLELSDPYQIAFIFLQSPNIENASAYTVKNGFTYAQVPATHETNKIIAKFNEGALVDASEFTRTIKRVRV